MTCISDLPCLSDSRNLDKVIEEVLVITDILQIVDPNITTAKASQTFFMVLEDRAQLRQTIVGYRQPRITITIAAAVVEAMAEACPSTLACLVLMICTRPMRGALVDVT